MTTKSVGKVKLKTDPATGKTRLTRVHTYDASKARRIAKGRSKKIVAPARAAAAKQAVSFVYTDATGRTPKLVKATRTA